MGREDYDWRVGSVTLEVPRRHPRGEDGVTSELPTDLESEGGSGLRCAFEEHLRERARGEWDRGCEPEGDGGRVGQGGTGSRRLIQCWG